MRELGPGGGDSVWSWGWCSPPGRGGVGGGGGGGRSHSHEPEVSGGFCGETFTVSLSHLLIHQTLVPGHRVPGTVLGAGHPEMVVLQELAAWGSDPQGLTRCDGDQVLRSLHEEGH